MLNLVSLLKDVPEGTKLWSPVCGECELVAVRNRSIDCKTTDSYHDYVSFTSSGKFFDNGECVLFPSKENRDWLTLRPSQSHKEFENFQKVLVKDWRDKKWVAGFYSHYDDSQNKHCLVGFALVNDEDIIPYDGNEDKIGKAIK